MHISKKYRFFVVAIVTVLFPSAAAGQLGKKSVDRIRQHLPRLLDEEFDEALHSPDMVWYESSRSYQLGFSISADREGGRGVVGIADSTRNISGDFPESRQPHGFGGNLNAKDANSWPWLPSPGGTHRSDNVSHVKGLLLPEKPGGGRWPIIVYRTELEGVFSPQPTVTGTDFTLPIGSKVVELITVDDTAEKQHYVCEVRWRFREPGSVSVELFRPFPRAADLAEFLGGIATTDLSVQVLREHCLDTSTVSPARLRDRYPGNRAFGTKRGDAFDVRDGVDLLPRASADIIRLALDTKRSEGFESALGVQWKPGCTAPTADSFHIVPVNYDGAFVGSDSVSCANCHRHALVSARRFDPQNGKYGWLRGNKPVVSEDLSLERGGFLSIDVWSEELQTSAADTRFKLNERLEAMGLVEFYNASKHPRDVYFGDSRR